MLQAFPTIATIVPDELFSLQLTQPDCSVLIDLPPDFPSAEPILLVEPVVVASEGGWVLPSGQVRIPGGWTQRGGSGSGSLVRLLKDLEGELCVSSGSNRNGDALSRASVNDINDHYSHSHTHTHSNNNSHSQSHNLSNSHSHDHFLSVPQSQQRQPSLSSAATATAAHNNPPQLPTSPVHRHLRPNDAFLVEQLDAEQMEQLMADEEAFRAFLTTLESFQEVDSDALQAENYRIAGMERILHSVSFNCLFIRFALLCFDLL